MKADGTIYKYKARLAIKGFRQQEVHQMNVKMTSLNGDLEKVLYMNQPEGFMDLGLESKVKYPISPLIFQVMIHLNSINKYYDTYVNCIHERYQAALSMIEASQRAKVGPKHGVNYVLTYRGLKLGFAFAIKDNFCDVSCPRTLIWGQGSIELISAKYIRRLVDIRHAFLFMENKDGLSPMRAGTHDGGVQAQFAECDWCFRAFAHVSVSRGKKYMCQSLP
ncbi:hypothetical protein Tco_1503180 [Tanacetum coccineum]